MGAKIVVVRGRDGAPRGGEIGGEIHEIAPVGVERVPGGAALGGEHVEEQFDQGVVGLRPAGHRS
jgi:hypothetical protein